MFDKKRNARRAVPAWRKNSSPYRKVLQGLLIFSLLFFIKVWQKVNVDYQYRRNGELEIELKTLRGDNALLAARIEELRSAERLTRIAAGQLHMVMVPKINLEEKNTFERLAAALDKIQK